MSDELDNLQLDTRIPGEKKEREFYLLPQGEYVVEISTIEVMKQDNSFRKEEETVVKFTFKTLEAATEDDEVEPEDVGLHGIISAWPRLTAYELEPPKDGTPSALSVILDNIFRRKLTEDEARNLSIKKLVGLRGKLIVDTGKNGKPKFISFRTAKNSAPEPKDFAHTPGAKLVAASKFEAEKKLDAKPSPKKLTTGDVDDEGGPRHDNIPDPYAD